ncbi:MAG TPA: hypothetical protein VK469_14715 [Candidatus Kapabacteria bacterium]|nr:hypothetical protein [Candidatus Kapabacteria bacterium]
MRKIDKSKILSTAYKKWVDQLDKDNIKHPQSREPYYYDVVMNLLHCQKGVCAYTEMFLCNSGLLTEDKWIDGHYIIKKPERFGHLEHFNPDLKKDKFYQWDNLFVISADINVLKGEQKVDAVFKPDSPQYDPMKFLEYDIETHFFIPHTGIKDPALRERIDRMIDILQINHATVYTERESFLKCVFGHLEMNRPFKVYKFFTACRMAGVPVEDI